MAEQKVIDAVTRLLKKRGAWHFNVWGGGMGRNGLPDIIAIYRGTPLAIECKSTTGKLRPLQRHELDRAKRAGAIVVVARTAFDVKRALDQIDEHATSVPQDDSAQGSMCAEKEKS
jgi:Holliday junction resolvase